MCGEEIEINKRIVKLTKKYKRTETRKFGRDVKTEKMTKGIQTNARKKQHNQVEK